MTGVRTNLVDRILTITLDRPAALNAHAPAVLVGTIAAIDAWPPSAPWLRDADR